MPLNYIVTGAVFLITAACGIGMVVMAFVAGDFTDAQQDAFDTLVALFTLGCGTFFGMLSNEGLKAIGAKQKANSSDPNGQISSAR